MSLQIKLRGTLTDKEGRKSGNVGVCYNHFSPNCPTKVLPSEKMVPTDWCHQFSVVYRHLNLAGPHQNSCRNQESEMSHQKFVHSPLH